ncbi:MAG: hypothetical protein DI565_00645 [Ancylobacter novellus]|uniref:Uncharacterized protein n=1 Tax=Ancylobacter novellus TaxID=921 RepID=A0A2W5MGC8_ANCNO|nr:MAG: hypothetical protein DI565_00645 [Ancylobacter novellus]
MTDYAQDHFYYGGRIVNPGDEIEPASAADRKSLEERGLIAADKPKGALRSVAQEHKAAAASPENKAGKPSPENKTKS